MKTKWVGALAAGLLSSGVLADTVDTVERVGDVLQVAIPATALIATYTLDDPEGRWQLLQSYGATFAVTHITKRLVNKERPDGSNRLSFPSGHTSSAFSGASFLAKRYGWDVGVPAYLAASFTGYSRVVADKHDWIDVGAGALLAIGLNEWLVDDREDVTVSLLPQREGWVVSLNLHY